MWNAQDVEDHGVGDILNNSYDDEADAEGETYWSNLGDGVGDISSYSFRGFNFFEYADNLGPVDAGAELSTEEGTLRPITRPSSSYTTTQRPRWPVDLPPATSFRQPAARI